MKQGGSRILLLVFLAVSTFAAHAASNAKADQPRHPVRVHYSGNLEGELEPCG
jgi:hypothetical protein